MIVCKLCGNANPDQSTFCGDCGKFLEWAGETVVVPETITVIEEPPPEVADPVPKGWWRRLWWRLRRWRRKRLPSYKIEARDGTVSGNPASSRLPADVPAAAAVTVGAASIPAPPGPGSAPSPVPAASTLPSPTLTPITMPPPAAPPPAAPPPAAPPPRAPRAAAPPAGPPPASPPPSTAPPASGPPPAAPPPSPPPPAGPPPVSRPPFTAPPAGGPPPAAPPPGAPPPPSAPPPAGSPPAGAPGQPGPGQQDDDAAREAAAKAELAAALVNPVEGTAVMPDYDTPELPPQPVVRKVRPIVKTKPSRRLEPGDLVCAACGEGNAPTRKFCSRCGESLAEAGVVRAVWWRRFFRWVARLLHGPSHPAGTRPGQKGTREHRRGVVRRVFRRARLVLLVLLAIVALIYIFDASFRATVFDDADTLFHKVEPGYSPVQPVQVTANVQTPGYPPAAAADEYNNTYWLAPWNANKLPTITFKFGSSVVLHKVILLAGADGYFVQNGRPSILKLTYSDGSTQLITLDDTSAQQTLTLSNSAFVSSVSVQVVDIYPGEGNAQNVAITEMQWFQFK